MIKEIETVIDYEYFIRYQDEFDLLNAFRKPNYLGADINWKPRLLGLLGYDSELFREKLKINSDIDDIDNVIKIIRTTKIESDLNKEQIDDLRKEKEILLEDVEEVSFINSAEKETKTIITKIDNDISNLNIEIFSLRKEIEKIEKSINRNRNYEFSLNEVEVVFSQVKIYFGDSLKRDISELKDFYEAIYSNRNIVLSRIKEEKQKKLIEAIGKRNEISIERKKLLDLLIIPESKQKYKETYNRIIEIEKRLSLLERDIIHEDVNELEKQKSKMQTTSFELTAKLSKHIDSAKEVFDKINSLYSQIMKMVMNIDSEIHIEKKNTGNLDFELKSYRNGLETEELKGDTAKRISAAAIDIAIRCIRNDDNGFIAHDGVIDDIDKNSAEQFLNLIKKLASKYKFQYIMTALKDRLPLNIDRADIILELNDYSDEGLLFGIKY